MKALEKTVRVGKKIYAVVVEENGIYATENTYPIPGYGNNYGTGYNVILGNSPRWASAEILAWNEDYASRGHGPKDQWVVAMGHLPRKEAEEFYKEIRKALEEAEDGTPDVKAVFDRVKTRVTEACEY